MKKKFRSFFIKNFEGFRIGWAVLIAFSVIAIAVLFVSKQPLDVLYWFVIGPSSSIRRFGNVIEQAIPFIFCGLSVSMMLQANKFNLASDGIFYISGAIAAYVALRLNLPPIIFPIVVIAAAALAGGAIAFIPAFLDTKFKANVVVSSIMLNYVLLYLGRYILIYVIKDPTLAYNASAMLPEASLLARLIPKTRVHTGIIIALVAAVLIYVLIYKTKIGYEIRITGKNKSFGDYSGINTIKAVLVAQIIGGALAGMGGAVEILGIYQHYRWDSLLGYGFDGLLIAIISKNNPKAVVPVAFFLAYLRIGADLVNSATDIPLEVAQVLQALVIILVAAKLLLAKFRHKILVEQLTETTEEVQ